MSVAEKLTEIAENVPKVFEAGVTQGYESGYEDGKQGADFWGKYQMKGHRLNYDSAFANPPDKYDAGWHISDFKPQYDMRPDSALRMFQGIHSDFSEGVDLVEVLKAQGVTLNFQDCKSLRRAFAETKAIHRVGRIDARSADDVNYIFYDSGIVTVDKLIVHKDLTFVGSFSQCYHLENISIEGEIGNKIQFHRGMFNLSGSSIISIINALSDDVTGQSVYFNTLNIENVFGSVDSPIWLGLVNSKPNWTFVISNP